MIQTINYRKKTQDPAFSFIYLYSVWWFGRNGVILWAKNL